MTTTVQDAPLLPIDGFVRIYDLNGLNGAVGGLLVQGWYEDGDYQAGGLAKDQMAIEVFKSRGRSYAARETEDTEVSGSWSCHLVALTGGPNGTPADAIRRRGAWRNAVSTSTGKGNAYTVCIEWYVRAAELGASQDAYLRLKYCHCTVDLAEGVPGKLSFSFRNLNLGTDAISDGAIES